MTSAGKKEYTLKINGLDEGTVKGKSLLEVLNAIGESAGKVSSKTVAASKATKTALTDEEKAAKKLEETQRKIAQANSDANRKQIEANEQLREATRLATLKAKEDAAVAGSLDQMRARLSRLNLEWKGLEVGSEEFNRLNAEILELNDNIKAAEEGAGDFRRSVGNYEKATAGLGKLSEGLEGVTKTTQGLAQGLLGATNLMSLFGSQSEEDAERAQKLQKIIALLTIARQVNNNVLKQGVAQNKAASVLDAVRTTQIKAKTAAEAAGTKGTIAATAAQKIFNIVASANPYVLLALALVGVGTALVAFASKTDDAAKKQKELNELQKIYNGSLEREIAEIERVSAERIRALERERQVLEARGNKAKEIAAIDRQISAERQRAAGESNTAAKTEIGNLEKNRESLKSLREEQDRLNKSLAEGRKEGNKTLVDIDGKKSWVKIKDRLDALQDQIANYEFKVTIATNEVNKQQDAGADAKAEEERQKREAVERARAVAKAERDALRGEEDARIKLLRNADEQARQTVKAGYARQIEDLNERLKTETNLTVKAREAIKSQIETLDKQKAADLEKLQKEQDARALALQQEVEDSRIALMVSAFDREYAEANAQYDRQIAAYRKRLDEDKTLTEQQQAEITELIENAQKARGAALSNLLVAQAQERADLELSAITDTLTAAQNKIDEMVVRNKSNKLELIDVDATKQNYTKANEALGNYILDLQEYLRTLESTHKDTLATMREGSTEYQAEQQAYARTVEDVTQKIKKAQKDQADNTEASTRVQVDALEDMFGKITKIAQQAADVIGQGMTTFNMALSAQIEDLNAQLDVVNERYTEAQKQHESAAARVEELEAQMQSATGGTVEALKEQLQDAMHARNEAARQEQRLAKEKERAEAEIAKKEKQMKRADLIANIAVGVANVAQAVTKALTAGPIIGQVLAGITAALGAVQVGVMSRQLAKLAEGGEIVGPSHAAGGVPILINGRPSYEAQGGEFMVNDRSYGANKALVQYINATPRAITAADLAGVVPGGSAPVAVSDATRSSEDRIREAIEGIDIRPTVAVTDIHSVDDTTVEVRDLAGI